MRIAGIVTEYNPFHDGHRFMIGALRDAGFDAVVCVMSGPFVQRGEAALFPSYLRAEAAVLGGADLVLRLPAVWAAASAERFGRAGVSMLSALGCVDAVCFGAETPDVELLSGAADVLEGAAFDEELKKELASGVSFASARAAAAGRVLPGAAELLAAPNNILGVEYCKALAKMPAALADLAARAGKPAPPAPSAFAIGRQGAAHDGPPTGGPPSAGWLRRRVAADGVAALCGHTPPACCQLYKTAAKRGDMLDAMRYEVAMLSRLRARRQADFDRYPDAAGGLGARMAIAVKSAVTLEELYGAAKTKRFAHARIRRLAVAAALEFPENPREAPPFLHVLAANETGKKVLARAKETALLPVGVSLAKLEKTSGGAQTVANAEAMAEDLHALCLKTPRQGGLVYTAQSKLNLP